MKAVFNLPLRHFGSASGWPLALIILAAVAHAPAVPLLAWLALILALLSRRLPERPWAVALRLSGLLLTAGAAGLAYGWLESSTLRIALLGVLALKWAESRQRREYLLVSAAAAVAIAIGSLQWSEGIGMLFILLTALLLLCAFDTATEQAPNSAGAFFAPLKSASWQLLTALPLAGILFLFFPRIPGPLWDIGLTFGLPLPVNIEKSNRGLGISARLKPGQQQTGASESQQPVLVAEFANWVPPTSQLYWRGPVFYDFDGQEWQLDPDYAAGNGRKIMQKGWRRSADFGQIFRSTAQEVNYKVRLTPHGGLWLYALDLPSRLTAESFIGPDWQVLAHMPVTQEISYELSSWLEWTAGGTLPDELRQRALRLPEQGNPRLRALGDELKNAGSAEEIMRQAMTHLARDGYAVRDQFVPPSGPDALDAFWFDAKAGNSELYAAAFVVLMRSAGVPARLVTGYRGGKLMALTDYVVVKRSHAHAWVEIWDNTTGWRRIDPVDVIAPERFAGTPAVAKKPTPAPAQKPQSAPKQKEKGAPPAPPAGSFNTGNTPSESNLALGDGWKVPDLTDWIERWIFRLDAEKQMALLAGKGGGFAWIWLLAGAVACATLLFAANFLFARWRSRQRLPAPQRAWDKACRLLARKGLAPKPTECPSLFAGRVSHERPAWGDAMQRLAALYTDWRYGPAPDAVAADIPRAARLLINRMLAE